MTKALSIVRAIYLMPSIIAAGILTQVGPNIVTTSIANTIVAVNSSQVFTEVITSETVIQNEIWLLFHFMIMLVLSIYVLSQFMILMTKAE